MTDKQQPEALRLAALMEKTGARGSLRDETASELRRLHAENETLRMGYAELERVTDDLAALVRQLVRSLRKAAPDNELADKALDYLKRKGLQGSPLRHNAAISGAKHPID